MPYVGPGSGGPASAAEAAAAVQKRRNDRRISDEVFCRVDRFRIAFGFEVASARLLRISPGPPLGCKLTDRGSKVIGSF